MGFKEVFVVIGSVFLMAIGSCMAAGSNPAHCNGWVCVGPCGGSGQCAGHGCVCVGYSTGAGRCVSQ
jgi:hypothetical protein